MSRGAGGSAQPFRIEIADEVLDDLRQRLAGTRWADDFGNVAWEYGSNGGYLRELIDYWQQRYDWRAHERLMNAFPHFRTEIDGLPIHFIHQPGTGKKPLPLILSHGWPWTFWDFQKIIRPLADPASCGADPDDSFDVVVPSLPGYGFSTPLLSTGVNAFRTADIWVELMQKVLGFQRFGAAGGDWGALITTQLGHKYPDALLGIYIHLMISLDVLSGGADAARPEDFAPDELPWQGRNQTFLTQESGYSSLQMTKPQTPAFALTDSPAGLAAWIVEKRRAWSDCAGNVESRFSKDDLLTTIMLYWATRSIGSSMRYYYEALHRPWVRSHQRWPVVEAPTGIAVLPNEVMLQPRRWAERYYNLQRWSVFPRGGHFAPMEEPERLVEELRTFFRPLRSELR
jgi:pimeloyl-ACP methyl ester carboxylesterase